MQKKYSLIIVLLLFLSSITLKAQESWSLENCIKYAFDNNIQIKQQMLNVKMSQGNLFQTQMSLLPNINGSGSQSFNFDRSIIFGTNQAVNGDTKSTSLSLSASVSLFRGLQKFYTIKQYQFDLQATACDVEKIKNNVALNVASAYLQILYSEELVATSNRQVDLSKLQVEKTTVLVKAGSLPEGSLLEIEAQLASDELQLVNAQNQADLAYLGLIQLLEIKSPEGFKIQKPMLDKFDDKLIELTLKGVFETAVEIMPQIKSANYRVLSSQQKLRFAKGGLSPSLSLNGYYGSTADKVLNSNLSQTPFFDQLKKNVNKSVTFNLSIPIFNGWLVKNNISNAKIVLDNARLTFENEKNILYKDIQQAYTDALASQKKLKATQKNLIALTEAFRYSEQKFNVGMVTSIDYTTAKNKLSKAETDLLQAKYELIFKSKILEFYKGIPLSL